MRIYGNENLSLEQLWAKKDTEDHFGSLKTLYRYHHCLAQQLDSILTVLCREITLIDVSAAVPDILPGQDNIQDRLRILFRLLDSLVDMVHQKQRSGIILEEERYSFLNYILHWKAGLLLCDSS